VKALNIPEKLKQKKPLYIVDGPHSYPIRKCNQSNVDQWNAYIAEHPINRTFKGDALKMYLDHVATNWTQHAIEATHMLIKAFQLAQVPLIVASGTHLGWFRSCSVMDHTNDLDFYTVSEYIVSLEHFDLLVVRKYWYSK
jgi:hypothetical protein